MITRKFYSAIVSLFLIFLHTSAYAKTNLDHVVAVVNHEVITNSELETYAKILLFTNNYGDTLPSEDVLRGQILNQMVLKKIQLQIASISGLGVEDEVVNSSLSSFAAEEDTTVSNLEKKLANRGIKYKHFIEFIHDELLTSKLQQRELSQEITISKNDIDGFLNSPAGQDQTGVEYKISHILMPLPEPPTPDALNKAQQKADLISKQLSSGDDFAKIAMANSSGQQALNGGDLGWRKLAEIPSLFTNIVPTMQLNEVSSPIRNATGYHIIKLMGKRVKQEAPRLEMHVRQILIKPNQNISEAEAKKVLNNIRSRIAKGESFDKLAEKHSEELSTATRGGDLGWVNEEELLPSFWNNIVKIKEKELSLPFKTEMGVHLVEVLAKRTQNSSNEAIRNKAMHILRNKKYNEILETWLKRIKNDATVEIL